MEHSKEFNLPEFIDEISKISQKIITNYLENSSGYHHDNRDIAITYFNYLNKLFISPTEIVKVQDSYLKFFQEQQVIWKSIFTPFNSLDKTIPSPFDKLDRRFLAKEWSEYPYFNFIKQNYFLLEKLSEQIIDETQIDDKSKKKIGFYNEQYMDLFSPANFLATNPEALKRAFDTSGKSLRDGFNNLMNDVEKGRISQVDESLFEVGKNLATTPGNVVFENELIQLIQYSPSTKKVQEIPLLIIPPWINKFYILDIDQKKSFVNFLVEQGITVYMISWRNPIPGMGHLTFDDYVKEGALKAIEVARAISNVKQINTLGYCLGGTLLSVASAIVSTDKNNNPINSATFLASMIDFSDIGPMGDVIDEALVKKLERGEMLNGGIMHGHDMERAFNLIRASDLVWYYAVNNYLLGLNPSGFDVMYWTNDNTNLPAEMYKYYMRNMILENKLSRKNALTICKTPIDISKIEFPVFVVGLSEDYISPAKTAFVTTELVSGQVEFILGGSGHVIGVINPPSKNKYGYYIDGKLGGTFEEWRNSAKYIEGSWWTTWTERLINHSGKQIAAPEKAGNEKYKIIEPAPGRYVKEKCHLCFKNKSHGSN